MYWLVYSENKSGQHVLRIQESVQRPEGVEVINHGFSNPAQALAVISHYLEIDAAGFVRVNDRMAAQALDTRDRLALSYRIAPGGMLLIGVSLVSSIVTLVLLLMHLL